MGQVVLAAKKPSMCPSMCLSGMNGTHKGCRKEAIQGHHEISRRCRQLGVDTVPGR